jgi:TolA-binding protein
MTFDLEAARAGIAHYRIENHSNVDTESAIKELVDQANLAEDALAEIERLRADLEQSERVIEARLDVIDQQAARIKSLKKEIRRLKHESKVEQEFTNSYIKRLHDAEARIKELGSSLDEAEALTKQNAELMNGYLRRIAELEDALVEGLTNFLHYRASCYDPARRCPYAKECDDCSTWDACGHVEMFRSEARRQLQAEGKIGPDAKPRVWQITEERKKTSIDSIELIELNNYYNDHTMFDLCNMLHAMLKEAE